MKDLTLRLYRPKQKKLKLIWEHTIPGRHRSKDSNWFIDALRYPIADLDVEQFDIRAHFTNTTSLPLITQGMLLCVGTKQCYVI